MGLFKGEGEGGVAVDRGRAREQRRAFPGVLVRSSDHRLALIPLKGNCCFPLLFGIYVCMCCVLQNDAILVTELKIHCALTLYLI